MNMISSDRAWPLSFGTVLLAARPSRISSRACYVVHASLACPQGSNKEEYKHALDRSRSLASLTRSERQVLALRAVVLAHADGSLTSH
jgi:hypothetical protein